MKTLYMYVYFVFHSKFLSLSHKTESFDWSVDLYYIICFLLHIVLIKPVCHFRQFMFLHIY